ncbi:MAG: galactose-1-phosphate uridylyltransferase [Planctomycetes bacterium]|nr:galactose-1-phosphate uridylyltransferase [Planctomycetota bacterium]
MSELRQNIATKEWYVLATERAKRPEDFVAAKPKREKVAKSDKCPFCPGNEAMTPPATLELPGASGWQVRAVPNKFSAFSPVGSRERHAKGIYRSMSGVGIHEVIIETPRHDLTIALLPVSDVETVVEAYRSRYLQVSQDPRVEHIILFKNHGESAGCSLEHPHSQLIATPLVPTHIRYRLEEARHFHDDTGQCVFCVMVKEERKARERMVYEDDLFVAFAPYASGGPFEVWILPKRHQASFGDISDEEVESLALTLKDVLARMYHGLSDPDFNYVIRSVPKDERHVKCFHWYIKLMPKLARVAGFELGTGMFVNVTLPEANAKFLREVKLPSQATTTALPC